tara:strand:+ start:482 stop:613 length:132 start_codon:yes stop_codon:yes gene_type:complete
MTRSLSKGSRLASRQGRVYRISNMPFLMQGIIGEQPGWSKNDT